MLDTTLHLSSKLRLCRTRMTIQERGTHSMYIVLGIWLALSALSFLLVMCSCIAAARMDEAIAQTPRLQPAIRHHAAATRRGQALRPQLMPMTYGYQAEQSPARTTVDRNLHYRRPRLLPSVNVSRPGTLR